MPVEKRADYHAMRRHHQTAHGNEEVTFDTAKWKSIEYIQVDGQWVEAKVSRVHALAMAGRKDDVVPLFHDQPPTIYKRLGLFDTPEKRSSVYLERLRESLLGTLAPEEETSISQYLGTSLAEVLKVVPAMSRSRVGFSAPMKPTMNRYTRMGLVWSRFLRKNDGEGGGGAETRPWSRTPHTPMKRLVTMAFSPVSNDPGSLFTFLEASAVPQNESWSRTIPRLKHTVAALRFLVRLVYLREQYQPSEGDNGKESDSQPPASANRILNPREVFDDGSDDARCHFENLCFVTGVIDAASVCSPRSFSAFVLEAQSKVFLGDVGLCLYAFTAMLVRLMTSVTDRLRSWTGMDPTIGSYTLNDDWGVLLQGGYEMTEHAWAEVYERVLERKDDDDAVDLFSFINQEVEAMDRVGHDLMVLLYCCSGGPGRATEMSRVCIRKGQGLLSSLMLLDDRLAFLMNNSKKHESNPCLPKFPPASLSRLVLFWYGVARPVQVLLMKQAYPAMQSELEAESIFMFMENGAHMSVDSVRMTMRRVLTRELGLEIGFQFMRQSLHAIFDHMSRVMVTSEAPDFRSAATSFARQALLEHLGVVGLVSFLQGPASGHSRQTAEASYFQHSDRDTSTNTTRGAFLAATAHHEFLSRFAKTQTERELFFGGAVRVPSPRMEDNGTSTSAVMKTMEPVEALEYLPIPSYRGQQLEMISAIRSTTKDVLLVAPTAFGKSIVVLAAALGTPGVTFVMGPLNRLKENMYSQLKPHGKMLMGTFEDIDPTSLAEGHSCKKIIFISASQLAGLSARALIAKLDATGMLAGIFVDEIDALAEWSSFRPDLQAVTKMKLLNPNLRVLLATASMTDEEAAIILANFGITAPLKLSVPVDSVPNRISYRIDRVHVATGTTQEPDRLAVLVKRLKELVAEVFPKKVMIFFNRKSEVLDVFGAFQKLGCACVYSYSGVSRATEDTDLARFQRGEVNVLLTTDENNRGINIPGVTRVILVHPSGSIPNEVQRAGRGGRGGERCDCIMVLMPHWQSELQSRMETCDWTFLHRRMETAMKVLKLVHDDTSVCIKQAFFQCLSSVPVTRCREYEAQCAHCVAVAQAVSVQAVASSSGAPSIDLISVGQVALQAHQMLKSLRCFYCGYDRHQWQDFQVCPVLKREIVGRMPCFKCGGDGHFTRHCPNRLEVPSRWCKACGFPLRGHIFHNENGCTIETPGAKTNKYRLKEFVVAAYRVPFLRDQVSALMKMTFASLDHFWTVAWEDAYNELQSVVPRAVMWLASINLKHPITQPPPSNKRSKH